MSVFCSVLYSILSQNRCRLANRTTNTRSMFYFAISRLGKSINRQCSNSKMFLLRNPTCKFLSLSLVFFSPVYHSIHIKWKRTIELLIGFKLPVHINLQVKIIRLSLTVHISMMMMIMFFFSLRTHGHISTTGLIEHE